MRLAEIERRRHTRLPTFSMNSTLSSSGFRPSSAWPIMCPSRWHPLPVFTCSALTPVARMRSASFDVRWSPSMTASFSSSFRSSMVRQQRGLA